MPAGEVNGGRAALPSGPEGIGEIGQRRCRSRRAVAPGTEGDQRRAEVLPQPTEGEPPAAPAVLPFELGEVRPQPVDPGDA